MRRIINLLARTDLLSYLIEMIEGYLSENILWYGIVEKLKEYTVKAGVSQGSALGVLLRNEIYNGILIFPVLKKDTIMPEGNSRTN